MQPDQLPGSFFGPSNLVDLVRHRAQHQSDQVGFEFLLDGETDAVTMTYADLDRQARAIGAMLQDLGLEGDRALLLYPAGLDFVAAFFGCLYAGVVAVPAYPPRRNRNMARVDAIAADAQAKIALTTQPILDRVQTMLGDESVLRDITWRPTENLTDAQNGAMAENWTTPDVHPDTLAFFQYTSGSTGTPKGVMLTHANLLHNSAMINYAFEETRSDRGVFWLPLYHDMGLIGGILQPLYLGGPSTLFGPSAFLQRPLRWLQAISRKRATISGGPNFAYDLCVDKITEEQKKHLDLSSWEIAFNGAEPIRPATLDRFAAAFESCGFRREAFYPCYGLAEATLIVTGGYKKAAPAVRAFESESLEQHHAVEATPDEEGTRELVGCGGKLLDERVAIVDPETCRPCPTGRVGEIWVSGLSVAQGYWNRPEETERAFNARIEGAANGPYLRTGDLGFLHDGELFVTGRLKDLIIVRGVNHYPQDIEFTVENAYPELRPASGAAFSVGEEGRERVVVVQEVSRKRDLDHDAIFEAVRRAVAIEHELALEAIVLLKPGSIPRTSSGKIQRHACRADYLVDSLSSVARWPSTRKSAATGELDGATTELDPTARRAETVSRNGAALESRRDATHVPKEAPAERVSVSSSTGRETLEIVFEVVREVARERAVNLSPETDVVELGLDSLERMEIVARLEEKFGGQFPLEVIQEMHTCQEVADAVREFLGDAPVLEETDAPAEGFHATEDVLDFAQFPEYKRLQQTFQLADTMKVPNPFFNVHEAVTNDRTIIDGKEYINFSSFNYLGMSGDPVVTHATVQAIKKYGTSASASRVVSGEKTIHKELERAIADLIGAEDAIALVGGHATNQSTIGHLMGARDLIVHDALAHNSIQEGTTLSGARRRMFPHNDIEACDRLLSEVRHRYRRAMIIVEGVYSMDGDYSDLQALVKLKKKHGAMLMVDEAHSIGTMGLHGRGMVEFADLNPRDVDIWMGTLSKSLGSCGGYVAGSRELIEYLKYTLPGFVFAAGISPANAAAALASIQLLEEEPERVAKLSENSALFLRLAKEAGLDTGLSHGTPVVPVIIGHSGRALVLSHRLHERGINVHPILHPAVEESAARLRFFISSTHTEAQIRETVSAVAEELAKLGGQLKTAPADDASTPHANLTAERSGIPAR